jgi:hypothetical protein
MFIVPDIEKVLAVADEQQILCYLLSLPQLPTSNFKSPFRVSDGSTCGIIKLNTGYFFKDFARSGNHIHPLMEVAGMYYGKYDIDTLSWVEDGYNYTLERLLSKDVDKIRNYSYTPNLFNTNSRSTFSIITKIRNSWNKIDEEFWNPIPIEMLNAKQVFPIDSVFVNGKHIPKMNYTPLNPTYGYLVTRDNDLLWKIYKPYDTTFKWRSNVTADIKQGTGDLLATSYKDAMTIELATGIPCVNYQGESYVPTNADGIRYVVVDNDKAGLEYGNKLNKAYGIIPITLEGGKDAFEVAKNKGLLSLKEQILQQYRGE